MRLAVLLAFVSEAAMAQDRITGRVVDATTHEPVPFCSVTIQRKAIGTLTNEEGVFELPVSDLGDSLVLTMVGYARKTLALSMGKNRIELIPTTTALNVVEVRPDVDRLYQLVARCAARMRRGKANMCKVYFEMGAHMDQQPVEVVECFYNGHIDGPHVASLDLKQGRMGIAPVGDRFFVSTNMTKAIGLLDIRKPNDLFPACPLQWTRARAIAEHYRVMEIAKATDGSLEQVRLEPKDTSGGYFTTEVWIDGHTAMPRSILLTCRHCREHPFQPVRPTDHIRSIDMQVHMTLGENTAEAELQHMELACDMGFEDAVQLHTVHTEAIVNVIERDAHFLLPVFDYNNAYSDHEKILFLPYDSSFWATAPTLVHTERQESSRKFFAAHGFLTGNGRMTEMEGHTFLMNNYVRWAADQRLSLRCVTPPADAPNMVATMGPGQIHLEAQLYLDVDTVPVPRIFTATVFDELRSYYHAPELRQTDAFLNIFFDLCEIERRRMDSELRAPGLSHEKMLAIHDAAVHTMRQVTLQYSLETNDGIDLKALAEWNERVKEALGIDNFALIGLDAERSR